MLLDWGVQFWDLFASERRNIMLTDCHTHECRPEKDLFCLGTRARLYKGQLMLSNRWMAIHQISDSKMYSIVHWIEIHLLDGVIWPSATLAWAKIWPQDSTFSGCFFCLIHYYSANNCHCLCYHDLIFLLFDYTVYLILIFSYFTNPFLALYCVIVLSVLVNSLGFSWPKQLFKLLVICFINQLILNREGYTDIERGYYNLDNFPVAYLVAAYWVFGQVLFWVPLLQLAKIQKFLWIDFLPFIWTPAEIFPISY